MEFCPKSSKKSKIKDWMMLYLLYWDEQSKVYALHVIETYYAQRKEENLSVEENDRIQKMLNDRHMLIDFAKNYYSDFDTVTVDHDYLQIFDSFMLEAAKLACASVCDPKIIYFEDENEQNKADKHLLECFKKSSVYVSENTIPGIHMQILKGLKNKKFSSVINYFYEWAGAIAKSGKVQVCN